LCRCVKNRSAAGEDEEADLYVDYQLECKICINTYKLFYVEHTEDALFRKRITTPSPEASALAQRRFQRWWNGEWEALGNGPIEEANAAFRATFSLH
jgi:paired amphipathic helix protein Sin3a